MHPKEEDPNSKPYVVDLGERSYPVYVKPGLIESIGKLIKSYKPSIQKIAIVTSDVVWRIHGRSLNESFKKNAINVENVWVPEGEEAKSWAVAERLIGDLLKSSIDRQSAIISFGGGAIGDVSGFVASIYLRGLSLIQVPTTLLAQVDSSLGGKTAVNHPKGKNLIGTFHQPTMVFSDTSLLQTLPKPEILSGLGEAVKSGVIADGILFNYIENNHNKLAEANIDALAYVVKRSVAIKGTFITRDERDSLGIRAALNYGHTTGHALERLLNMQIRHGEAVALGMMVASRLSELMGRITTGDVQRQRAVLDALGFDLNPPKVRISEILEVMRFDKKVSGGLIRFVLPTGIGSSPTFEPVSEQLLIEALEDEGYE